MRAATLLFTSVLALGTTTSLVSAADTTSGQPQNNTSSQDGNMWMWEKGIDVDGDGNISQQEAAAYSEKSFVRYDVDANGDISNAEWRTIVDDRIALAKASDPSMTGPEDMDTYVSSTFVTEDADGNGIISRAEWDGRATTHFATMDANSDGMIDANEAPGAQNSKKGS